MLNVDVSKNFSLKIIHQCKCLLTLKTMSMRVFYDFLGFLVVAAFDFMISYTLFTFTVDSNQGYCTHSYFKTHSQETVLYQSIITDNLL